MLIHGLQPQGREHILETEEASVQESEDRGEETGAADDGCQIDLFEFIKQEAADQKAESLARITEHGAEDQRIRDGHKDGRVDLVVSRQTVHPDVHFEGFEQLRVFQLGRRLIQDVVLVVLQDAVEIDVILDILLETLCVSLGHPSAEDVEDLFVIFCFGAGCKLSHVKVGGKAVQRISGLQKITPSALQLLSDLCLTVLELLVDGGQVFFQLGNGLLRVFPHIHREYAFSQNAGSCILRPP